MIPLFVKKIIKAICLFTPSFSFQKNRGFCPCCDSKTEFVSISSWFRDKYRCVNCMSIPRERALILAINKYYPNWKDLSIHESSPNNTGASAFLQKHCKDYLASQFFPNKPLGSKVSRFINQNLENQTFQDEIFDIVVTQDVFEHIFQPGKAFKEICRTLKVGGAHIFSVPIVNRFRKSEVWSRRDKNGNIKFLKKPEFHGNPIDPAGSPVSMHWGFDIIDFIKAKTNMETQIEDNYDLHYGLSARYLEIFISKKKAH